MNDELEVTWKKRSRPIARIFTEYAPWGLRKIMKVLSGYWAPRLIFERGTSLRALLGRTPYPESHRPLFVALVLPAASPVSVKWRKYPETLLEGLL
jgi:hypothetical protein